MEAHQYIGRFNIYPKWWPIRSWSGYNQEELEQLQLKQSMAEIQVVKALAQKYNLGAWVSVCQYSNMTLTEWIGESDSSFIKLYGLPDLVQKAIVHEIDQLAREISRQRTEKEQQIKLEAMSINQSSPFKKNDSLNRIFG